MDRNTFRRTLRQAFWIPFGIAIVLAATLLLEVRFLMHQAAWVEHPDQVISLAQRIYRSRIDQESGLRAYLLTRDQHFLQPFYDGQDRALALEPELRRLIADNPEQTERNEESYQAIRAWLSWADQAVAMTKAGEDATSWGFQFQGKQLMDEYRRLRTEFIEREQQLRDERLARSRRTVGFVNASIVALVILFASGFAISGRKQLTNLSRSFTQALDSTREQRDWLHTTLTSIGDAVISTDAGGRITLMNPVAEELTGWTLQEAQDKPLADVFRIVNEQTRETVENPVDKVRRLNRVVGLANHTILVSKNGQDIAIDDSGAPIFGPDGAMAGIVLVFRDVTEQRAQETRRKQLEAALQSNERLALAGRLSASIAHEIHNPLDTVGNALFLINQRIDGQWDVQNLVRLAQDEVQRVSEISKSMLSLHRESRAASPVKLSELLESVVALIEDTIAKGRRNIEVLPGFTGEVEAFPSELRQVFTNVIKNAVEATAQGGDIRIYSEAAQESAQNGVLVRVVDKGVGVPENLRSRLFTPFVTTKEESGTGLGLWVSRSILEKHGGSIRLDCNVEPNRQGTTVSIFLPLKMAPRQVAARVPSATRTEAAD